MGPISATAAGLSLSFRAGCMRSASVASALGADISETNMNKGAACLKVKKEGVKMSASIEENFQCPKLVVSHCDGQKEARRAVYNTSLVWMLLDLES